MSKAEETRRLAAVLAAYRKAVLCETTHGKASET